MSKAVVFNGYAGSIVFSESKDGAYVQTIDQDGQANYYPLDFAEIQELRSFLNENFEPAVSSDEVAQDETDRIKTWIHADKIDPEDIVRAMNKLAKLFRENNKK